MSLQEFENTIAKLPPDQLAKFREWFLDFDSAQFDKRIADGRTRRTVGFACRIAAASRSCVGGRIDAAVNHFSDAPHSGSATNCYQMQSETLADKNFALLKANPNHPSLHFKKVGRYRSAAIGLPA